METVQEMRIRHKRERLENMIEAVRLYEGDVRAAGEVIGCEAANMYREFREHGVSMDQVRGQGGLK